MWLKRTWPWGTDVNWDLDYLCSILNSALNSAWSLADHLSLQASKTATLFSTHFVHSGSKVFRLRRTIPALLKKEHWLELSETTAIKKKRQQRKKCNEKSAITETIWDVRCWKPHLYKIANPSPVTSFCVYVHLNAICMYIERKRTLFQPCCSKETCHCLCLASDLQLPQQALHHLQEPQ